MFPLVHISGNNLTFVLEMLKKTHASTAYLICKIRDAPSFVIISKQEIHNNNFHPDLRNI